MLQHDNLATCKTSTGLPVVISMETTFNYVSSTLSRNSHQRFTKRDWALVAVWRFSRVYITSLGFPSNFPNRSNIQLCIIISVLSPKPTKGRGYSLVTKSFRVTDIRATGQSNSPEIISCHRHQRYRSVKFP